MFFWFSQAHSRGFQTLHDASEVSHSNFCHDACVDKAGEALRVIPRGNHGWRFTARLKFWPISRNVEISSFLTIFGVIKKSWPTGNVFCSYRISHLTKPNWSYNLFWGQGTFSWNPVVRGERFFSLKRVKNTNNLLTWKIEFPIEIIEKYSFFETGRWDLKTTDNNVIKLPPKNYLKSLQNYLSIRKEENFRKYKVFDYRLNNQLIMK